MIPRGTTQLVCLKIYSMSQLIQPKLKTMDRKRTEINNDRLMAFRMLSTFISLELRISFNQT